MASAVLADGLFFSACALQAIAKDDFSRCFRSSNAHAPSLPALALFPLRLLFLLSASLLFAVLLVPVHVTKSVRLQRALFSAFCWAILASLNARVTFHGRKPTPSAAHVFVANHTSFVDFIVLSAHAFPHATVAQQHGGLIGLIQTWVLALNGSLVFNRAQAADRKLLVTQMKTHVADPRACPLLIFPEGTCVNNEYTVLFHKGAFDLGVKVCPVAIKYDKSHLDPYWNTREQTFTSHILYLMTRWSLVADVFFLPPTEILPLETPVEYASRVKALISSTAKLQNLSWDGYLKNFVPSFEKRSRMLEKPQSTYGKVLLRRFEQGFRQKTTIHERVRHIRRAYSVSINHTREFDTLGLVSSIQPYALTFPNTTIATPPVSSASSPSSSPSIAAADKNPFEPSTTLKNEILVALNTPTDSTLVNAMLRKKTDLVKTWKLYTKIRNSRESGDDMERRIENGSWRLWFKQRLHYLEVEDRGKAVK